MKYNIIFDKYSYFIYIKSYIIYIWNTKMKDNKGSRPKRGFMVINLIEIPSGYSIIEGT